MKNVLSSAAVLIISGFMLSFLMGSSASHIVVLEKYGVRLFVPSGYVVENRFPWIAKAEGLDENEGSVVIRVPAQEIKDAIISNETAEVIAPRDLIAVVKILHESELSAIENANGDMARKINEGTEPFSEAFIVDDHGMGQYRLYQSSKIMFRWYVLLQRPPIVGNDVIALCTASEGTETSCRLTTFVIDGLGVEVNLGIDDLRYYREIKQHLTELLMSWRSKRRENFTEL